MAIYCGVDFHARQQTVCYCDTADGVVRLAELDHQADDVRGFYSAFADEVVVGIEASGNSTWFVELIEGLGHRVLIGDAAEVRRLAKRRQKNDRRDAGLILDLLLKGEFRRSTALLSRAGRCCGSCATGTSWCNCVRAPRTASRPYPSAPAPRGGRGC